MIYGVEIYIRISLILRPNVCYQCNMKHDPAKYLAYIYTNPHLAEAG